MNFADQLELRDPQMVAEFANDIYANMRRMEFDAQIEPDYITKV